MNKCEFCVLTPLLTAKQPISYKTLICMINVQCVVYIYIQIAFITVVGYLICIRILKKKKDFNK